MMTSKLPIRKTVEPLFRIVNELEKTKAVSSSTQNQDRPPPVPPHGPPEKTDGKSAKIYGGVNNGKRSRSVEAKNNRKNDDLKRNIRETLQSKDEQIEKLLEKITTLFNYNTQFAHENEKLQKDKLILANSFHAINQKLHETQTGGCKKCTELEEKYTHTKTQHEKSHSEAHELRNDVKMLKVLVFRLNLQLEYYQDVIRENRNLNPSQIQHQIDAASSATPVLSATQTIHWGEVKSHVLAPLLNAYEETISEKNDLIQHYHSEMNTFTSKIKLLITENEKLQQQMDEMKTSKENWMSEKVRMQAQLDICRNKADIQTKRADLGKEKVIELIRCYEQKIQSQALDIERLQEAYSRSKCELATLRAIQQNPEVVVDSLKECQKLFEHLKQQYNDEKIKLTDEIQQLTRKTEEQAAALCELNSKNKEQTTILERQRECNEILMEKNSALKQNMHRLRHSREVLKARLKTAVIWSDSNERGKQQLKHTYEDLKNVGALIRQKEEQVRKMQYHHYAEVDTLNQKLKQRDETVRKVLQNKASLRKSKT